MGGISGLMMVMMMSGGKMGAGMIQAIIAQRKKTFENWKAAIEFLAEVLLQGFFWIRGIPVIQTAAGVIVTGTSSTAGAPATLDAVMAQIQGGQQDDLTRWFATAIIEKGVKLLMQLIQPSPVEESMMAQMLGNFGGGGGMGPSFGGPSTTVVNQGPQPQRMTPNQVRASGGHAQGVTVGPDGYVYNY